ncbi:zona pellucida-like domain-containing protein 1 [Chanos chanos]|uniref:Zona pellucida-like domain-containing protein 1 n=1 Tax=Chanos chanos TaxID=29144 RepID=A0A6J2WXB9_CHACN|nr:zona pellucida-like domain-containing protein 1 [Chanos chanos]
MRLYLLFILTAITLQPGHCTQYNCSSIYNRIPDNSDMTVDCGPNVITLEVNLCTAQWAGFNSSSLAMNGQHNNSLCLGTVDTSVNPPVVRYQLPVNSSQENPCRQSMQIVDEAPVSDVFSSFSSIQWVIVTGFIDTPRSSGGVISYSTDLYYHFSCRYPLEYFINNTQIVASSVSVATNGNNGTFINTLSMNVYNDTDYGHPLIVPDAGLSLRTNVYVEVKATNLTGTFHVLLDHCFATPSPYNASGGEQHDFFIGCNVDSRTTVMQNGIDMKSRFFFETFRFMEHYQQQKSTIYLHCIVRLCEPNKCQELLNVCSGNSRRRRDVPEPFGTESMDSTTISVGPIYTRDTGALEQSQASAYGSDDQQTEDGKKRVAVGVVVGGGATALVVTGGWFAAKKLYWGGTGLRAFH